MKGIGGGVLIAVSADLTSERLDIGFNNLEHICVKVSLPHGNILVYCAYVPPEISESNDDGSLLSHVEAIKNITYNDNDV